MKGRIRSEDRETYLNPVYSNSFPDPFVLKHRGQYYGYCTGHAADGLVFGIIRSDDLVHWHDVGGAMEPIADAPPFYWAPEVTYDNGKFYLYYSAGNETLMHLRVAVSDRPDGGFVDSGHVLTTSEFAIDAHVFTDDDGSRYMFYATDFLEHTHIGTGTVVDRMADWFHLEGRPQPVTRAKYDWQVYDPQRKEKGGVRWHTVEGPTVLKRKGRYFEMFSGGNWQNTTYGVSFAVSDEIFSHEEWHQFSDGERVLPVLRTIPGLVVGPGHNSVVRGPNDRELFCVYHSWTDAGRVLAIDRMDFAGDRLFVTGATYTPQIAPYQPAVKAQTPGASLEYSTGFAFLCEFTLRCGAETEGARSGFRLLGDQATLYDFSIAPEIRSFAVSADNGSGEALDEFDLPPGFDPRADHLIRIECLGTKLKVTIDGPPNFFTANLISHANSLVPYAEGSDAEFAALTITDGFEDLFDGELVGWDDGGSLPVQRNGEIELSSDSEKRITHRQIFGDGEFVANVRLGDSESEFDYGLQLLDEKDKFAARLSVRPGRAVLESPGSPQPISIFEMPEFDARAYHQLRLVRYRGSLTAAVDGQILAEVECLSGESRVSIFCRKTSIFVEMVRATSV